MIRKYILILALCAFAVTTFSAGAMACDMPMADKAPQSIAQTMDMDEPCHEDAQKEHCEDICLCQHMSINQSFTLSQTGTILDAPQSQRIFTPYDAAAYALTIPPPQQPPRPFS